MGLLQQLNNADKWEEYYQYKISRKLLTQAEEKRLRSFIDQKEYKVIAQGLSDGRYHFSPPEKHLINKNANQAKRVVYTYNEQENMILKLLSYLLNKYDDTFAKNCYAFRQSIGARKALQTVFGWEELSSLYTYKADIRNYFNSIDAKRLVEQLKLLFTDDPELYRFFAELLLQEEVIYEDIIIKESKGAMAGTPISPFLANVYLTAMDRWFAQRHILYARYSDDIIVFASTTAEIDSHRSTILAFLDEYGLAVNPQKEVFTQPGEMWTFLGFSYQNGIVDLAPITIQKMKGKIKRKARKLNRWKQQKEDGDRRALVAMNRHFNRKFYTLEKDRDLSWTRWYFPFLTTIEGLKEIDTYMQEEERYIVTGKHNKANYEKVPYAFLQACEYRPLVAGYYQWRKKKEME